MNRIVATMVQCWEQPMGCDLSGYNAHREVQLAQRGAIGEAAKRAVVSSRVLTISGRDAVSSNGKAEGSLLQPFVTTTSGIGPTESVAKTVDAVATVTGAKTTNVAYPAARALVEKKGEEEERRQREGGQ